MSGHKGLDASGRAAEGLDPGVCGGVAWRGARSEGSICLGYTGPLIQSGTSLGIAVKGLPFSTEDYPRSCGWFH